MVPASASGAAEFEAEGPTTPSCCSQSSKAAQRAHRAREDGAKARDRLVGLLARRLRAPLSAMDFFLGLELCIDLISGDLKLRRSVELQPRVVARNEIYAEF